MYDGVVYVHEIRPKNLSQSKFFVPFFFLKLDIILPHRKLVRPNFLRQFYLKLWLVKISPFTANFLHRPDIDWVPVMWTMLRCRQD